MTDAAVVAPHRLSALAGRSILEDGGNAVDAAIATVAVQGVVAPETCGIGGDLFTLVHRPGWYVPRALNASGRSGSNADAAPLRSRGLTAVPPDDPVCVTIPGCVDGLATLSDELGSRSLADCLGPAIEIAERGFDVSTEQAFAFGAQREIYAGNEAVAEFYPSGSPVKRGDIVKRPALAATLRQIADGGRDAFYSGTPGEDIVRAVGGLITHDDLTESQAQWVEPIGVGVRDLTAWTTPPNSQGYLGPGALAVFDILEPPDDPADPVWWHLLIEAYRCLAWESPDVVADPGHLPMPAQMFLDPNRLERAAATVSRERAGVWPGGIGPPGDTAYMCVADSGGMGVSIIQSNYHGTGSPFGATRSGFLLHDRGRGFSLVSGHPNELSPGKRPFHTLSPTLWTDEGARARWLLGTRGGHVQPQLVAQVAVRAILGRTALATAQYAPRWTVTQVGPGALPRLAIEPDAPEDVVESLRRMGHTISVLDSRQPGWGPASIIHMGDDATTGAADPRVDTATALTI